MRMLLLAVLFFAQRPVSAPLQTGTVTGRLFNADGSPAVRVRVSAMAIPESRNGGNDAPALITLTETDSTGRYRLTEVPTGRYYIVAGFVDSPTYYPRGTGPGGATAVNVTARATTANIDFQIEKPSTGLTVSGRVIMESAPLGTVQVMLNGGPAGSFTNLNVPAKLDGSFEFVRVRPGTYNLSVSPVPFFQPRTLVVAEKDVSGLELRIPWTGEVTGRASVEGGDPLPMFQVAFTGGNSGIRQAGAYQANQTFRATLAEGFYGVTASGIPPGFYVKSITSGATNLLSEPLRISRTNMPAEIVVTLGVSTPSPWVKLSGRLTGSRANVSMVNLNGPIGSLQANIAADGTFEFAKVLPGTYTAYTNANTQVSIQPLTIVVPNRDLMGVELALPVTKEIAGRVIVEDGGPLPRLVLLMTSTSETNSVGATTTTPTLAQVLVTANTRPGQTSVSLNVLPDGTFKATIPEGQYQFAINIPTNGSPPPYSVKAFTYGATDVMKDPVRITASDPAEMRLIFGSTSPNSFARVSGRVLGLTLTSAAPISPTVTMNSPSFLSPMSAAVRADGTFEFPKVYSGNYQLRLSGTAANVANPNLDVNVGNTDITNLEIVVPRQKEISGRILLEGRGPMPQVSIPLTAVPSSAGGFAPTTFFNINPQPDGTFKITLPEGERQVGRLNGLPAGYTLKSLFYGSTDLAAAPLKISTADTSELRLTLSTSDQPPVKVSGKVTGLDAAALGRGPISISMNAPGYAAGLQAAISADGSFEFPAVFPGNYTARVTPGLGNANLPPSNIVVGSRDVTGVEIVVPRQKEIPGRLVLEGRGPMPQFGITMNNVVIGAGANTPSGLSMYMAINPQPDGSFRVTLPEGERRAGVTNNLPAGYTLKAITYGSTDLLTAPFKVDVSDTAELRVTLSVPNLSPVKVSGKLVGPDAALLARGPYRVNMNAPGYAGALQTTVAQDGSFEFPEVFPGNYSARVTGPLAGPQVTSILVAHTDVRNIQIVLPILKEIAGRVVVEGLGAPIPRFAFRPTAPFLPDGPSSSTPLASQAININPVVDGTFRLTLPEGERPLGEPNGLPPGYTLKGATYGSTDLLRNPLKIAKTDTAELLLTLGATGVKSVVVGGRVEGLDPALLTQGSARIVMSPASYVTILGSVIKPDGSFEFPAVFPGSYTFQIVAPGLSVNVTPRGSANVAGGLGSPIVANPLATAQGFVVGGIIAGGGPGTPLAGGGFAGAPIAANPVATAPGFAVGGTDIKDLQFTVPRQVQR